MLSSSRVHRRIAFGLCAISAVLLCAFITTQSTSALTVNELKQGAPQGLVLGTSVPTLTFTAKGCNSSNRCNYEIAYDLGSSGITTGYIKIGTSVRLKNIDRSGSFETGYILKKNYSYVISFWYRDTKNVGRRLVRQSLRAQPVSSGSAAPSNQSSQSSQSSTGSTCKDNWYVTTDQSNNKYCTRLNTVCGGVTSWADGSTGSHPAPGQTFDSNGQCVASLPATTISVDGIPYWPKTTAGGSVTSPSGDTSPYGTSKRITWSLPGPDKVSIYMAPFNIAAPHFCHPSDEDQSLPAGTGVCSNIVQGDINRHPEQVDEKYKVADNVDNTGSWDGFVISDRICLNNRCHPSGLRNRDNNGNGYVIYVLGKTRDNSWVYAESSQQNLITYNGAIPSTMYGSEVPTGYEVKLTGFAQLPTTADGVMHFRVSWKAGSALIGKQITIQECHGGGYDKLGCHNIPYGTSGGTVPVPIDAADANGNGSCVWDFDPHPPLTDDYYNVRQTTNDLLKYNKIDLIRFQYPGTLYHPAVYVNGPIIDYPGAAGHTYTYPDGRPRAYTDAYTSVVGDVGFGDVNYPISSSGNPSTAVDGQCGSANNQTLSSLSSSSPNLCSQGSVANYSGSGPWSWQCSGSNGGSSASCTASRSQTGSGTATCPSGTISFSPANPQVGQTVSLSAPDSNWSGGTFSPGSAGQFTTRTAGTYSFIGTGWNVSTSNGTATNCLLSGSLTFTGGAQTVAAPQISVAWQGFTPSLNTAPSLTTSNVGTFGSAGVTLTGGDYTNVINVQMEASTGGVWNTDPSAPNAKLNVLDLWGSDNINPNSKSVNFTWAKNADHLMQLRGSQAGWSSSFFPAGATVKVTVAFTGPDGSTANAVGTITVPASSTSGGSNPPGGGTPTISASWNSQSTSNVARIDLTLNNVSLSTVRVESKGGIWDNVAGSGHDGVGISGTGSQRQLTIDQTAWCAQKTDFFSGQPTVTVTVNGTVTSSFAVPSSYVSSCAGTTGSGTTPSTGVTPPSLSMVPDNLFVSQSAADLAMKQMVGYATGLVLKPLNGYSQPVYYATQPNGPNAVNASIASIIFNNGLNVNDTSLVHNLPTVTVTPGQFINTNVGTGHTPPDLNQTSIDSLTRLMYFPTGMPLPNGKAVGNDGSVVDWSVADQQVLQSSVFQNYTLGYADIASRSDTNRVTIASISARQTLSSSVSFDYVLPGMKVVVTGSNLNAYKRILFGSRDVLDLSVTPSQISFTVPSGYQNSSYLSVGLFSFSPFVQSGTAGFAMFQYRGH